MCGIVGVSGAFESGHLQMALDALAHRGPDSSGMYEDRAAGVGLAHARLSILDLSPRGHQPMVASSGDAVLAFNGEIYNFQELRADLQSRGQSFTSESDTEVLLELYREYRHDVPRMLRRLNGIFAFAIWDVEKQALLLARDALGVKPLYYSDSGTQVVFASEIKAMQPLLPSVGELDVVSVDRYLTFLWCPGDGTPSKLVRKVNPGEALWVANGRVTERLGWYRLPVFRPSARSMNADEAIKGTEERLRRAVHRQLVADVPVGAFLSGGLDSSSIVAFARERNPDIRCFTIDTPGTQDAGMTDDLPYARRVAAHLGVPLDVVTVTSGTMARDLEAMVGQLDEPLADPAPLNVLYIGGLAREAGIKVLLSGAGGDDLLTGYRRHRAEQILGRWGWLPKAMWSGLGRIVEGIDQNSGPARRLSKFYNGAGLTGDARLVNYFRWASRRDLEKLYTPAFRDALGDTRAEAPMRDFLADLAQSREPLERLLALEQRFFLPDHNLTYTDKMSMASGVEVRVPFLDLEFVEFASCIPIHLKQHGSVGKWVLKKAMEQYLPLDIIYRPKSGFGLPLRRWMRFELRELVKDVLSSESLSRRGLFDAQSVHHLLSANDEGRVDASYTILSLVCIELWCRRFVDDWQSASISAAEPS